MTPHISQFNSLMESYAWQFRLGDVVAVLTHMVAAGIAPNANTYRILLLACQRADQAELAFEVYTVMRLNKVLARDLNAQSMCYTLLKCCMNRLRERWQPGGYPPRPDRALSSALPSTRTQEARQLLAVLSPPMPAGARGSRRHTFLDNKDNINWVALALGTYRDFVAGGLKPDLNVLDKVLMCMRLPLSRSMALGAGVPGGGAHGAAAHGAGARGEGPAAGLALADETQALLRDLAREASAAAGETQVVEMPFERRTVELLAEAINMGLLPSFTVRRAAAGGLVDGWSVCAWRVCCTVSFFPASSLSGRPPPLPSPPPPTAARPALPARPAPPAPHRGRGLHHPPPRERRGPRQRHPPPPLQAPHQALRPHL